MLVSKAQKMCNTLLFGVTAPRHFVALGYNTVFLSLMSLGKNLLRCCLQHLKQQKQRPAARHSAEKIE